MANSNRFAVLRLVGFDDNLMRKQRRPTRLFPKDTAEIQQRDVQKQANECFLSKINAGNETSDEFFGGDKIWLCDWSVFYPVFRWWEEMRKTK